MTVWRATNPDARDFPVDMGFTNLCIAKTSNSEQKIATTKIFSNIHFAFGCKVESNNENQILPSEEKCELALEGAGSQEHSDKIAMLVDDDELELRELQGWPNALGCSDHFTTNGDHACSLCKGWFEERTEQIFQSKMKCDFLAKFRPNTVKMKHPFCMQPWDSSPEIVKKLFKVYELQTVFGISDFLAKFPPNSVKMKHPFCMQPWHSSPEIVKKLFKVDMSSLTIDEFAQAFQDKVENQEPTLEFWKGSLNPLTWTEILRQVLVAAGFGSKQGAMRRDALSKEMSLVVKYGLRPGTLKGELFGVLLELARNSWISSSTYRAHINSSEKKVEESQLDTEDSGAVDDDLGDSGTCNSDDDSGCNSGNSKMKKLYLYEPWQK
ncbi:unnamed protein product [Prunus armeniaca]